MAQIDADRRIKDADQAVSSNTAYVWVGGVALVLGGYGYLLVSRNFVAALLSFVSAVLYVFFMHR